MANEDILTGEELAELMRAIDLGNITSSTDDLAKQNAPVAQYDFKAPRRIISRILPMLNMINERFLSNLSNTFYSLTQQHLGFEANEVQMVTLADYLATLPIPSSINQIKAAPLRGTALVVFEPHLVTCAVDSFFGGGRRSVPLRQRSDFTGVEHRFITKLLRSVLDDMNDAWKDVLELKFERTTSDDKAEYASVSGASEAEQMLVTVINITMAGGTASLHVLMPYAMLEPLRKELTAGIQLSVDGHEDSFSAGLMDGIADIELPVSATLATVEITLDQLLHLHPGQVLPVQVPSHVMLVVDGMPTHRGVYGTVGEIQAVQITGPAWTPAKNDQQHN